MNELNPVSTQYPVNLPYWQWNDPHDNKLNALVWTETLKISQK